MPDAIDTFSKLCYSVCMNELAELKTYFKDRHVEREEIAESTGCSSGHIRNILGGYYPLSDGMRFRLIRAYPGLMWILLQANEKPVS